jgi:hypothetical protein
MYPYDVDPREYVRQALAMQTPTAPTNAFLPQMTPASRSYMGPTHQALSDTLTAALARQASNAGLFVPPPSYNTGGLLSPATPAASFFRMPSDFSKPIYIAPVAAVAAAAVPSTGTANTAQNYSGGGHGGPEQPTYSADFTHSNGPVGTANGFTGPYSNGGGPGNSFVDGTFLGGVGNFINSLFNPAPTPSSIDAMGSDRKTAEAALAPEPAPSYRLSSNDLMGGLGPQASIIGTPLSAPNTYDSQTLNGMLSANYEPVTGYDNGFTQLPSTDVSVPSGKLPDRIVSEEDQQANSAAARQQAEQAAAQEAANIAALQASDAQQMAERSHGGYSGMEHSPDSGYGANNGGVSTGGESASERSDGAWRMGGPVPKRGNGPPKPVRGTVHEGEYVIRPESVKVLPPGLLSALNDIYKSPNPKKTLRGLLG